MRATQEGGSSRFLGNARKLRVACALACAVGTLGTRASAAFTQYDCSSLPWGAWVPVDLGASDFNSAFWDPANYGDTEDYRWKVLVNSNVSSVAWYYDAFYTEYSYDRLILEHGGGSSTLTGSLGSGWVSATTPMGSTYQRHFASTWHSDSSVVGSAPSIPRLSIAAAYCVSPPNATQSHMPITVNERWDGILLASTDVIYTYVTQPANTRMTLTLDVLSSTETNPDFDLYASTSTAFPDDSDFTWRGYHSSGSLAQAGEALDLGATGGSSRVVSIGVRSYRGNGHFILRANAAKTSGGARSLTICHPGQANIQSHANWTNAKATISRALLRTKAATHGNIYFNAVTMKYSSGTGGDKWCSSISGCDWCMPHTSIANYCGYESQMPGRTRIPNVTCTSAYNDQTGLSLIIAHEHGHGLFGLDDEYGDDGAFCGHSIMNGPDNWTYRFCKPISHCYDSAPGSTIPAWADCSGSGSNWYKIANSSYGSWFYSVPSLYAQSSQPWERFHENVWARDLVSYSFQ